MWSPNAPSINTHQIALGNLKDRCSSQQKKLDDFEREKLVLLYENEDLKVNLAQLDEDNLDLRERNLEVNHQLKQSQYEILELRRHLSGVGRNSTVSSNQAGLEATTTTGMETVVDNHYSDTEEDLAQEVYKVNESMSLLKRSLIDQQLFVKKLIQETAASAAAADLGTNEVFQEPFKNNINGNGSDNNGHGVNVYASTENTTPTNSLTTSAAAALAAAAGNHDLKVRPQVCPMCEATFPAVDITHELFVDHVNSHFTCEGDPDTLHNYEVVDEAEASMLPAYYVA